MSRVQILLSAPIFLRGVIAAQEFLALLEGERNLSEKPLWEVRHEIFIDAAAGSDIDYRGWAGNLHIAVWRSQSSRLAHIQYYKSDFVGDIDSTF